MKALVGAFNKEKALVGAFSVIVQLHHLIDLRHWFSPRPSPCRLWAAAWCRAPRWWAAAWCPWEQVTSLAASHQPPASHLFKLKLQNTFNTSNNRDREAQLQPQGCWLLEPNILETSQKCYLCNPDQDSYYHICSLEKAHLCPWSIITVGRLQ